MKLLPPASLLFAGGAVVVLGLATVGCRSEASTSVAERVARGRYLVHEVAMCIDCHSPRGERGAFIEDRHLTGSPLGFAPTVPMPVWAPAAPSLAGLPAGYTEADHVHFLMTGTRPHGQPPSRPPMPEFRLNREDAEAVTAYLRSLPAPAAH